MIKRIKIDEYIDKFNVGSKRILTRELLADKVGVSYSLINNLQSGRVGKGYQVLNKLSEVLECTIDDLIEK
jgi:DNA-binding Xre family transcriptional regulator